MQVQPLGPTTIECQWQAPSAEGSIPKQYKLFYHKVTAGGGDDRANDESNQDETEINTQRTTHTLHGLEKYTEYSVRVEAEGDNGAGLSTEPLVVRTLSDVPSGAPRHVRAESVSTNTIVVQWEPPVLAERNGLIVCFGLHL